MAAIKSDTADASPHRGAMASRMPTLAAMAAVVVVLYFAQDVFIPLAIAILLTFAIAPIVSLLRKTGLPRLVAVILSVIFAFSVVGIFSAVVSYQVSEVATDIPTYQSNIVEKIRSLKEAGKDNGLVDRLSRFAERVGAEINRPEQAPNNTVQNEETQTPLLVEIFSPSNPIQTLRDIISPLIGPLATTGLIIVVVIFMLLEREELRDRFIRLVGYGDLHKTTQALQDAGKRVGQYLLMQLIVNVTYGIPLGIGLWLIGVPNAILWGMLAIVLRFVPYIGPVVAAVIPIFLAFAVAPGWSLVLWTIGLFILVELISNNVIEPWLYGSNTGLSPLAIIVAAIFWGWLWGPVGLVLSTPLTVCLVVLGRHVPQFEFFDILFGSEPVLDPKERLYQRLLAGDPDEATDNAEEMLEEDYLVDFYGSVAIPALILGEEDRARGVLTEEHMLRVTESARTLVANLNEIAEEEEDEEEEVPADDSGDEDGEDEQELPSGEGHSVLSIGGQTGLDDVAAAMLAQVLTVQGAEAENVDHSGLKPANMLKLPVEACTAVIVNFFNHDAVRHARFTVRRLRRVAPQARIGVVLWHDPEDLDYRNEYEGLSDRLEADFVTGTLNDAVIEALSDAPKRSIKTAKAKGIRRAPVKKRAAPKKHAEATG